jgi:hypothetical protein
MIYQSMVNTINSKDSIAKKLSALKVQEKEFLRMADKMKTEMETDRRSAEPSDYLEVFKIYDRIIPLMAIGLNSKSGKVDKISCLRAQRLIAHITTDDRYVERDPTLKELGLEGPSTAELLRKLCR